MRGEICHLKDAIAASKSESELSSKLEPRCTQAEEFIRQYVGEMLDAVAELEHAVRLEPNDKYHHFWLGYYHESWGLYCPALQEYQEALRVDLDQNDASFRKKMREWSQNAQEHCTKTP